MANKAAEWEYIGGEADVYRCSACHCFALEEYQTCPVCGAAMIEHWNYHGKQITAIAGTFNKIYGDCNT